MAMKARVVQDRRATARVITRLNCRFTCDGLSREAVVLDISLKGALLSSKFMPPVAANTIITLKIPKSGDTLNLEGKVLRNSWGQSDHGAVGKFSVRFNHAPVKLLTVLASLK